MAGSVEKLSVELLIHYPQMGKKSNRGMVVEERLNSWVYDNLRFLHFLTKFLVVQ